MTPALRILILYIAYSTIKFLRIDFSDYKCKKERKKKGLFFTLIYVTSRTPFLWLCGFISPR